MSIHQSERKGKRRISALNWQKEFTLAPCHGVAWVRRHSGDDSCLEDAIKHAGSPQLGSCHAEIQRCHDGMPAELAVEPLTGSP